MKLQKRLLILNTLIIFVCLIMLLMVVGIVTNAFRTQYIGGLTIHDFEIQYPSQSPSENEPEITPNQAMKATNQSVSNYYLGLFVSAVIAIMIIVFISLFFTKKIVSRIMIPVNKMMDANKRVENGNYDENIEYNGDYEFEQLCTSFNKMQKSLKEEKELNRKEQKSKEEMITGISHDLRTPLTSIKGYIKGLKDGVANTREKQEQYLDVAYNKACEMDALIEKLYELTNLEAGEIVYNMQKIHIGQAINDFLDKVELDFKEKKIKLNRLILTDEEVMVDIEQLNRVFNNIIYNSEKYANVQNLIIKFEAKKQDDNIIITIKDNGKGVEEDKIERIFEEFYRADESRTNSSKEGHGLGLYICKRIIEKHKGSIFAENDKGLRITIILPKYTY